MYAPNGPNLCQLLSSLPCSLQCPLGRSHVLTFVVLTSKRRVWLKRSLPAWPAKNPPENNPNRGYRLSHTIWLTCHEHLAFHDSALIGVPTSANANEHLFSPHLTAAVVVVAAIASATTTTASALSICHCKPPVSTICLTETVATVGIEASIASPVVNRLCTLSPGLDSISPLVSVAQRLPLPQTQNPFDFV